MQGGAGPPFRNPPSPPVQGGAGPPFRNPPSVWDIGGACGTSLRVWGPRLENSGRWTHPLVRSTFLPATSFLRWVVLPAGGGAAADGDQAGQDGERDLRRRLGADVQAHRALDPGDPVLRQAPGLQRLQVVAGA